MTPLHRLVHLARWHWWTDDTVAPEASLLLRSLGWLVQLARTNPQAFRGATFLRVVSFSTQTFWVALLAIVLALVIVAYVSNSLPLKIAAALGYIFWWTFVAYVLLRISNTSISLPDAFVSGALAFWLLIRLSRRVGLQHAADRRL